MSLSHASKALHTYHWEVYFLREVVSIWGYLPIYTLSYTTPELKDVLVFRVFSPVRFFVTFGIFIIFHCKRSWEKLPTSQTALKTSHASNQHPATFSAHLWMWQSGHRAAWRACCSSNPSIHASAQTLPTSLRIREWLSQMCSHFPVEELEPPPHCYLTQSSILRFWSVFLPFLKWQKGNNFLKLEGTNWWDKPSYQVSTIPASHASFGRKQEYKRLSLRRRGSLKGGSETVKPVVSLCWRLQRANLWAGHCELQRHRTAIPAPSWQP